MSVERELEAIADRAHALARDGSPQARETEIATLIRLGRIHLAIARDPALANLVHDVLMIARPAESPRIAASAQRYSDECLLDALRSTGSITAAAAKLRCSRRTFTRRLKAMGHPNVPPADIPLRRPVTTA